MPSSIDLSNPNRRIEIGVLLMSGFVLPQSGKQIKI